MPPGGQDDEASDIILTLRRYKILLYEFAPGSATQLYLFKTEEIFL